MRAECILYEFINEMMYLLVRFCLLLACGPISRRYARLPRWILCTGRAVLL